jgi:anti-anti-sigma factor
MDIEITPANRVTVVAPEGDLDMSTAEKVKRALTDLVDTGQTRLLVDLGSVAYIDSSGLGALVGALKHARASGGDLKLCGLQPDVHTIFEMTRLIKVITTYPARQEAVASWG